MKLRRCARRIGVCDDHFALIAVGRVDNRNHVLARRRPSKIDAFGVGRVEAIMNKTST